MQHAERYAEEPIECRRFALGAPSFAIAGTIPLPRERVRVRAFDAAVPSINEAPRIPSPNPLPGGEGFIAGPHTSHYVGRSRSARRMILPVVVIGSAPMNSTRRGYSCAARRVLTKSWISRASASDGAWLGFKTR